MFQWFDTRAVKATANAMADQVIAYHQDKKKPKKNRPGKDDLIVRAIATRVGELKKSERLNIYKTSQLANVFKWRLKEGGFDDAYIEPLLTFLLEQARRVD